jgi:hypothetical protein
VGRVHDDWVCRAAGVDCSLSVLPAYAPLVELHVQPGRVAVLTPWSVEGMIVVASTALGMQAGSWSLVAYF